MKQQAGKETETARGLVEMADLAAPNIDRLLAALGHRKPDRVANFEILIGNKVKVENYLAMCRATREFGVY